MPEPGRRLASLAARWRALPRAARASVVSLALGLLPLVALFACYGIDRGVSSGRVLRAVHLGPVSLGGMTKPEARDAIARVATRLEGARMRVAVAGSLFEARVSALGADVDVDASTDRALELGRSGDGAGFTWWWQRLSTSASARLVMVVDEKQLDAQLAAWEQQAISDPPFEGGLKVNGAKVEADPPRSGYRVDRAKARARIIAQLETGVAGMVELPLREVAAKTEASSVEAAAKRAAQWVAGPVVLENEEEELRVELDPKQLAAALTLERADGKVKLAFDPKVIDEKLEPIRSRLEEPPKDATFEIDGRERVTVVPSRPGTLVDPVKAAAELEKAATSAERKGFLPVERKAPPKFTTEDAEALHIEELLAKFTTFYQCCQKRVTNIHRIAELLDGVVVRPGETFSVNDLIGPRTKDKGFVLAPSIADGEFVDTPGGGISQFATTLFNAVLDAGLDVIERQPHSYYFHRYPVGHEATLSFPSPDLKFRNDTSAGVLIKTIRGKTSITVKLYGKKDGRKVRREVSRRFDLVEPPIEYEADEDMDPEKEKVLYAGQHGFSVNVSRIITTADGDKKDESRKVIYQPRAKRVKVHPCKIPEGEEGHTGEDCPEPEEPDGGADGGTEESSEGAESDEERAPPESPAPEPEAPPLEAPPLEDPPDGVR